MNGYTSVRSAFNARAADVARTIRSYEKACEEPSRLAPEALAIFAPRCCVMASKP